MAQFGKRPFCLPSVCIKRTPIRRPLSHLQPPRVGTVDPPQSFGSPMPIQFRPVVPGQQGQPFPPASSLQIHPAGQNMSSNVWMPSGQSHTLQYSQPVQQLPPRPGPLGHATSSQAMPMPYLQQNRPLTSGPPQTQQTIPAFGNHMHVAGGQGMPLSSSYMFQPVSQIVTAPMPVGGQPWVSSANQSSAPVAPVQQTDEQSSISANSFSAVDVADAAQQSASDWQEHTSADGRRYYYNKKTRQSSWEKPLELMTPLERADASTVWKEFTTPDGRKYYYNKVTKQSKWTMPEELKLAREQAEKAGNQGVLSGGKTFDSSVSGTATSTDASSAAAVPAGSSSSLTMPAVAPSPQTVPPAVSPSAVVEAASPTIPVIPSSALTTAAGVHSPKVTVNHAPTLASGSTNISGPSSTSSPTLMSGSDKIPSEEVANFVDGASILDLEEARKGMAVAGKVNVAQVEEKTIDDEPLVFSNKQEAKNAFKMLLESADVHSDWTWDQAMRVIINDKRYRALKTLGERKQAFNEYLGQRKKQEAEERRIKQKKAKEEFIKMLEESKELTSSMKWSEAITLFEDDERFKAVERVRDREELFENYLVELQKKEKVKAQEEYRRNREEYKKFLESCDFIKVNSHWRKVQDLLEDDERCSRLEKIDRLEIFQDYIRDLEKEEEEQKKTQKEQLRRAERKARDEFRKMLEADIAAGVLTAKTHWREYCEKVKASSAYLAVARNTSGSTPKDLFDDVAEELENQYHDDKTRIKDVMKLCKITVTSTWRYEDFKASIADEIGSPPISDVNLMLVFEEFLERIKEKEEKEAKKRQRLADEFTDLLHSLKEIDVSSTWDDCKPLFEDSEEYRAIGEESLAREFFEDYIIHLQDKAKEKERKREEEKAKKEKEREEKEKRKEKERKEKEREREREKKKERSRKDETDSEVLDDSYREDTKREKDKDREKKHRKRQHDAGDDVSSDRDEKEEYKKSRHHGSDRKKSRKHEPSPDSDGESRHKRHKKDHRDGSRRNGGSNLVMIIGQYFLFVHKLLT
ncbi:hypothetical protein Nepgr_025049 [Nepenthes gracilis]|uniref:Pre-mRNA-processing protein 40A n=1 Tax=Nepenthes gracilis TaxID=150966 RepID=A0AAD3Y135_NEPGR|nr:hypothetical protein Nepgr_025049 [Nepenthes gracilis]